jgi:hypothetical protein
MLLRRLLGGSLLDQAVSPVPERTWRDAKGGLVCESDARPTGRRMLPRKEREDRTRMSDLITVVQVIGPGIVKIDRLLDETHSQRARVAIEIAVGPSRDCGHVMDA